MARPPRYRPVRQIQVPALGAGGRNTDKASWQLTPSELADGSLDTTLYQGVLRRRRGFKLTQNNNNTLYDKNQAVYRANFGLVGRTTTITIGASSNASYTPALVDNNGTAIWSSVDVTTLPRAMYRDQLLLCTQDGLQNMKLYTGLGWQPSSQLFSSGALQTTVNQAIITPAGSFFSTKGAYLPLANQTITSFPVYYPRVVAATTTTQTIEDMRTATAGGFTSAAPIPFGFTYPCVVVYNAGTVSITNNTATGVGTNWTNIVTSYQSLSGTGLMGFLETGTSPLHHYYFIPATPATDTSLTVYGPNITDQAYALTARAPFKDVCVHNEVLYGAGVAQFPSRVYVSPAEWNMAYPPGAILPFDPTSEFTSNSPTDFILDFIDVPSYNDGDPIVALLNTDGPRLVLKKGSIYGLYGEPPNLTVRLIHSGDGCIDIRSAISVTGGSFWAGSNGIYRYLNGKFMELTSGWMHNEWRALTNAGIDYCTMGVDGRHLVVSIKTADAAQQKRTYVFDLELNRWTSELSNTHPRHMFSANIAGDITQLLCVDDAHANKVLNIRPALDLTGPARDESGTGPNMTIITGDTWPFPGMVEGEVNALRLSLHTTVQDSVPGATQLSVKMTAGGSLYGSDEGQGFLYDAGVLWDGSRMWGPDNSKTLGTVTSQLKPTETRNEFAPDRRGRRMTLRIDETTTSSTVATIEFGSAELTVRDLRSNT